VYWRIVRVYAHPVLESIYREIGLSSSNNYREGNLILLTIACNHFNPSWFVVSLSCFTFWMALWSHPLDRMNFYYLKTFQTAKLCSPPKWPLHFLFVGTDLKLVCIVKFKSRYLSSLCKFHTNFVFRSNLSRKPSQSYREV